MKLIIVFGFLLLAGCPVQQPRPIPSNQEDSVRCAFGDHAACQRIGSDYR